MMDVFIVDASSYDDVHEQLMKFKDNIKIVKTFQPRSPPVDDDMVAGTSNSGIHHSNNSITTVPQAPVPPAVSVVTFRWDDTIEPCESQRAR